MAALQQIPAAFQSRSPQPTLRLSLKLSFSSNLIFPKPLHLPRRVAIQMSASAAGSYAIALADVAKSNTTLDQTIADVEKLQKLFSDAELLNFFTNPTIGDEVKLKTVDEIARVLDLQAHVANFVNILVETKRIDLIGEIVKEFEVVYNQMTETELATVTSVVKLKPQHLAQIAKSVQKLTKARNVRIRTVIDPSLVAGFTVRFGVTGSKMIDLSVKKQLQEIAAAAELDFGDIQFD